MPAGLLAFCGSQWMPYEYHGKENGQFQRDPENGLKKIVREFVRSLLI